MRRLRAAIGAVGLLVGVLIALGPFISVSRVGAQMLGELPDLEGVDHSDQRVGWGAMFDDEFVLARRTFNGVDDRTVAQAMVANGFEPMGIVGFSKECCGDYDAVRADVQSPSADRTVVELTAADSDWRLVWPLFSGVGSLVALAGLGVLLTSRSSARELAAAHARN